MLPNKRVMQKNRVITADKRTERNPEAILMWKLLLG